MKKLKRTTFALSTLIALLTITGCNEKNSKGQMVIIDPLENCIDGVIYYSMHYRMSPAYNRDGSLKLCDS